MWRLLLAGGLLAAIVGGVLYLTRLQHTADVATSQAETSTAAATVATKTTGIVEHDTNTETVIHDKADAIVQTVEAQPGANDPVPTDVLSGWRAGIASLRDGPDNAASDSGSGPAGASLPASGP